MIYGKQGLRKMNCKKSCLITLVFVAIHLIITFETIRNLICYNGWSWKKKPQIHPDDFANCTSDMKRNSACKQQLLGWFCDDSSESGFKKMVAYWGATTGVLVCWALYQSLPTLLMM